MPSKINSAFYHQFLILSCVLGLCSLNCFSPPSKNNILENDTSEEVLEEETFSVRGTIHDQYNQPITNLFVTASSEFCIPDQTDEQGVFEIRSVEEGEKRLIIYGDTTPDGLVAPVSFAFEVENNHVFEAPIKMPRFEEMYPLNEDNSDEYTITTNDGLEITIAPSALNLAPFSPSELQVARVPVDDAPSFIPEDVTLVDLFVLHPILSTFDPPSTLSFPNDTELPIGSTVHGRTGNNLLVNGQNALVEPLTDTVAPEKVERWRIVNTANARTMWIDVQGAAWRIIAIDGTTLEEPYKTDEALLPIGRRFDIEVLPDADYEETSLEVLLPNQSGSFDRYPVFVGSIEGDAGENAWKEWPTETLPEASMNAEQEITLELDGTMGNNGIATWTINGETYDESDPLPVKGNTPTLIRIIEKSGAEHPYHLHGEFFQILERSSGEMLPGQMDTLLIEGDEEVVLWTEFTNIGSWMSHCHILEHAELGMMGEIIVE